MAFLLTVLKYTMSTYTRNPTVFFIIFHFLVIFQYCENGIFLTKMKDSLGGNNQFQYQCLVPQSCNEGLDVSAMWFLSSLRCHSDSSHLILAIQKLASNDW